MSDKNQHPGDTLCANFQAKWAALTFFGSNLPKNVIKIENLGNECQNKNQHPRDTLIFQTSSNFLTKRTNLTFSAQIGLKVGLGLKIQKTNVEIRNSILEIPCAPIFRGKQTNLTFLAQICPKMGFGVVISKSLARTQNQHLQDTMCANFQSKLTTLNFLA